MYLVKEHLINLVLYFHKAVGKQNKVKTTNMKIRAVLWKPGGVYVSFCQLSSVFTKVLIAELFRCSKILGNGTSVLNELNWVKAQSNGSGRCPILKETH